MDRREMIKELSLGLGLSISVPSLLLTMQACQNEESAAGGQLLSTSQLNFLGDLGEFILPRTNTPGAADLNLHNFVLKMLEGVYDEDGQKDFISGLEDFQARCKNKYGKVFSDCGEQQKSEFLQNQEKISPKLMGNVWGSSIGPETKPDFYRQVKSLFLLGYFSSEEIGRNHLNYVPVPGKFEGCIDYSGQKIDAL